MGETIEEIFVELAKPFKFNPEQSENTVFKREIPDIRSAFHTLNFQYFYKSTTSREQIKAAFLSWNGVSDLISKIIEKLYTSAAYDEALVTKYMLAKEILAGNLKAITVPTVSSINSNAITTVIKEISNDFVFMKPDYTIRKVRNHSPKDSQYLMTSTKFDAISDVETLAKAFNLDKVEFLGRKVLVDGFGSFDDERLLELFGGESWYTPFTTEEKSALQLIPAVLIDADFFMNFDNLQNLQTEIYNTEGLYWNNVLHIWRTYSISPFANCVVFVPGTPSVNSITVSPSVGTMMKGYTLQMTAVVVTSFFASKNVAWSIDSALSSIDENGVLYVSADETATTITVTATSLDDETKTSTATITIFGNEG